ncbi:DUF3048 domain-containing protein [Sutcliffiella deserti]|uniref:DUF3048 domain-containing protein n=1 Tax=Sutcliffiella deserti TaxID=2875501 RepID=UPI001CBC053C|nr:DUF3048 domain-containing protein [Sutcliffiella deserti]
MFSKYLVLLTAMMVILAGCSANTDDTATEQNQTVTETTPESSEEPAEPKETEQQKEVYPLTGTRGETTLDRRPFAVIINNDIKARPQSGLHKADVVYEVLAEGDITRLVAIFQSEIPPDTIGPVRSARSYNVDLAKGFDPVFVFHGWSPGAKTKIEAGEIDGVNGLSYDGTLFKRASFRKAPHNSYITHENIIKGANQLNYEIEADIPPLTFKQEADSVEGEATEYVKLSYSSRIATQVEYKFDEANANYVRYSGQEKNIDLDSSEEIIAHNIFIVETSHRVVDDVGRRDIDLTSGGRGILIREGVRQEVDWKEVDGRILPFKNEQPVPFTPGKTWIQIIPNLNIVSY